MEPGSYTSGGFVGTINPSNSADRVSAQDFFLFHTAVLKIRFPRDQDRRPIQNILRYMYRSFWIQQRYYIEDLSSYYGPSYQLLANDKRFPLIVHSNTHGINLTGHFNNVLPLHGPFTLGIFGRPTPYNIFGKKQINVSPAAIFPLADYGLPLSYLGLWARFGVKVPEMRRINSLLGLEFNWKRYTTLNIYRKWQKDRAQPANVLRFSKLFKTKYFPSLIDMDFKFSKLPAERLKYKVVFQTEGYKEISVKPKIICSSNLAVGFSNDNWLNLGNTNGFSSYPFAQNSARSKVGIEWLQQLTHQSFINWLGNQTILFGTGPFLHLAANKTDTTWSKQLNYGLSSDLRLQNLGLQLNLMLNFAPGEDRKALVFKVVTLATEDGVFPNILD